MDSDHIVLSALPMEEIEVLLEQPANQNTDDGGHSFGKR